MTRIIAVQEIWLQSSSDYNAVKHLRTAVFEPVITLEQVMEWAKSANCLQRGQVILSEEDTPTEATP